MTLRTRMAFMVILLLLGCVFAAPFYRSAISQNDAQSADTSLPTLQIQQPEPELVAPALDANFDNITRRDNPRHLTKPSSVDASAEDADAAGPLKSVLFQKPIPDLQIPLPQRGIRASATPKSQSSRNQASAVNPASLVGVSSQNFGARTHDEQREFDERRPETSFRASSDFMDSRDLKGSRERPRLANNLPAGDFESHPRMRRFESPANRDARQERSPERERNPAQSNELRPVPSRRWNEPSFNQPSFNETPRTGRTVTQRHRIARFDTLGEISKLYYGTRDHALLIFQANRDALINPEILPIGIELVIPERPDRSPRIQARPKRSHPTRERPTQLPALPIENQYGWKRAQDDRELFDD